MKSSPTDYLIGLLPVLAVLFVTFYMSVPIALAEDKLPIEVQRAIDDMTSSCINAGGKPMSSTDFLTFADLNNDGLKDFVIDEGAYLCNGAESLFSGSGGSQVSIYLTSDKNQATLCFSTGKLSLKIDKKSRPAKLVLGVGGELCGQKITQEMGRSDFKSCWRAVRWNPRLLKFEFVPLAK